MNIMFHKRSEIITSCFLVFRLIIQCTLEIHILSATQVGLLQSLLLTVQYFIA